MPDAGLRSPPGLQIKGKVLSYAKNKGRLFFSLRNLRLLLFSAVEFSLRNCSQNPLQINLHSLG